MSGIDIVLGAFPFLIWIGLWKFRSRFWTADQRLESRPSRWALPLPKTVIIVPARNESDILPQTLPSLLRQDYGGEFHVCLVDDGSSDGTADIARELALGMDCRHKLTVIRGEPPPGGWTGKLWALEQGVRKCRPDTEFIWFVDADIACAQDILTRLVHRALTGRHVLVSVMAKLRALTFWERLLIPAFVYFFAMIYPFREVNDPHRKTAAAAGGCLLLKRKALLRAGGLRAVSDALIDDCALARLLKGGSAKGRIWLGLSDDVRSLRAYNGLSGLWKMVARTAFVQLKFSPWLLAGTLAGMLFVFAFPPIAFTAGIFSRTSPWMLMFGGGALFLMFRTYLPMVRHFDLSLIHVPTLPVVAALYCLMTLDSAVRFARGSGGGWKGRTYKAASNGT